MIHQLCYERARSNNVGCANILWRLERQLNVGRSIFRWARDLRLKARYGGLGRAGSAASPKGEFDYGRRSPPGIARPSCLFQWAAAGVSLLCLCVIFATEAFAQSERVNPLTLDCEREFARAQTSRDRVWTGDQTLEFEHCFRIKNLQNLARAYSGGSGPEFFVDRIPAERLGRGYVNDVPVLRVVFPERVFFDTGRAVLRPEALDVVEIIAEALKSDPPDVTVFVAGHTDSRGSSDMNYNLSVERSEAVARALAGRRQIVANVWGIGFGEDMPLAANVDEVSWGRNRRVEFLFSGTPSAIAVWLSDMQLDNLCVMRAGEDSQRCKKEINLRQNYEAIEFVAPVGAEINPVTEAPNSINPSRQSAKIGIARERRVINPVPGRRFKINPQRRTSSIDG